MAYRNVYLCLCALVVLLTCWPRNGVVVAQMTASERISQSIKDRVSKSSNHVVINKNADYKAEATAPKPQPKKRATYAQQKKQALKLRTKKRR